MAPPRFNLIPPYATGCNARFVFALPLIQILLTARYAYCGMSFPLPPQNHVINKRTLQKGGACLRSSASGCCIWLGDGELT